MPRKKKEEMELDLGEITPSKYSEEPSSYKKLEELENSEKVVFEPVSNPEEYVSTGCTVLNLLLSNSIDCGFRKGSVIRAQGHESSGKTAFVLYFISRMCKNDNYSSYNINYRDHEVGATLNIASVYGEDTFNRLSIETPDDPSLEGEFAFIKEKCSESPSVIVEDSLDSLMSVKTKKLFESNGNAALSGNDVKEGAMGVDQRVMSSGFKLILSPIEKTKSLLFLISQKRESLDPFAVNAKFNTSGGNALKHAASYCLSFSSNPKRDAITRTKRGLEQKIGQKVQVEVIKNRGTGFVNIGRPIQLYLYFDRGFVDVESVLDFLIDTTQTFKTIGAGWTDVSALYGTTDTGKPVTMKKADIIHRWYYDKDDFNKARELAGKEWLAMLSELYSDIF